VYRSIGGHLISMSLSNRVSKPQICGNNYLDPVVVTSIITVRCKLRYRNAIKEAAATAESTFNDEHFDL